MSRQMPIHLKIFMLMTIDDRIALPLAVHMHVG